MEYSFERHRIDKIPREHILDELERVAELNKYVEFGKRDFARLGSISATPVVKTFGKWSIAIDELRIRLKAKGKELHSRTKNKYSDRELLEELGRIWSFLGHRPSRIEWESSNPKYSYVVYKQRFNGWTGACLSFIEWKQGHSVVDESAGISKKETTYDDIISQETIDRKRTRTIPLRIRHNVLKRDHYKCVHCGKSPATEVGVELHLDHIKPFADGGENTEDNLQTLCKECNLGKGKQSETQ